MYTQTTNRSITFILEGIEQVLALRAKISVEKKDIVSVNWYDKFNDWPDMMVRMPGSYLPAWVMAGSYWNDEGWDFVLAKKPKGLLSPILFDVLVVETNKQRYKRIILKMKQDKAEGVIAWFESK